MKTSANGQNPTGQSGGVLYQVSLLQGLAYGDYNGCVTVKELKQHGNTGIGTFHRLNGELILLDGEVYRAAGDGSVEVVSADETTPFAVAAFLQAHETTTLAGLCDYDALLRELDSIVEVRGKNRFYMIRLDGMFRQMHVRSVPAQTEPYGRLVDVLAQQQTEFVYDTVDGTLVGLYCPPYMNQLNAVGWHMHVLSKDKTKGGHVLGVSVGEAKLTVCEIDSFQLQLPQTAAFDRFDLTVDQSHDIEKIERNQSTTSF